MSNGPSLRVRFTGICAKHRFRRVFKVTRGKGTHSIVEREELSRKPNRGPSHQRSCKSTVPGLGKGHFA